MHPALAEGGQQACAGGQLQCESLGAHGPLRPCKLISGCPSGVQGLPEGHTEACYPIMRPGLDGHRAPPLRDSDSERREVSGPLCRAPKAAVLAEAAKGALAQSGMQQST